MPTLLSLVVLGVVVMTTFSTTSHKKVRIMKILSFKWLHNSLMSTSLQLENEYMFGPKFSYNNVIMSMMASQITSLMIALLNR